MREPRLKSHVHYSDLYDRHTVESCRRIEQLWKEDDKELPELEGKKLTKEQEAAIKEYGMKWYIHMETGERYLRKAERIREWMDADEKVDLLYESAQAPEGIRCLTCRKLVKPNLKELWSELDKPDRILFIYECANNCVPLRGFFSDGTEWRPKPNLCPKCSTVLNRTMEDSGIKSITTDTCPKCAYTNVDEYVWTHKKEEEIDENFAADRDRFCLTDEEGKKFQEEKWNMEQASKFLEEWKEKEKALAEKLEANPNGFILEGIGRRCAICGNGSGEDGSWYDKYGLKCLVCQKAIDEGEIPASLASDKESWYSKYDLESRFSLKGPMLRRWIKDGIVKARTVSNFGKGVHVEIFLIEDNKDFLPPKKLVESRLVSEVKNGETWTRSEEWYKFVDPFKHLKGYKIMEHMRVIPPEEMKAREEEKKKKWEEKLARKQVRRKRPKKL